MKKKFFGMSRVIAMSAISMTIWVTGPSVLAKVDFVTAPAGLVKVTSVTTSDKLVRTNRIADISKASAKAKSSKGSGATDSGIKLNVYAKGIYPNWEGVSNVSEFTDEEGNYCYAFYKGRTITIVKNKNGKAAKKKLKIKMQKPLFGAVTCDQDGNFYVVTGKKNTSSNRKTNTVFIAKYSKTGDLIATVGDNGTGCYQKYKYSGMDDSFNTQEPFEAGNCDITVNGNYVAVNYARKMYSGHQSNTAIILNRHTMQFVQLSPYYNSHSFAQRAIPYQDGFMLASEGDAYNRSFSVAFITPTEEKNQEDKNEDDRWSRDYYGGSRSDYEEEDYAYEPLDQAKKNYTQNEWIYTRSYDIFHFWIKKNSSYNMYVVNNNYAHMGGIAVADNNHVALVGTSVKAMNKKADKQKECLFIQIFDPTKDIRKPEAYATSGTRSGKTGISGDVSATDYGVKWLTGGKFQVKNPQVVADHKGRFVILFEKYVGYSYAGVYYTIINSDGTTAKKITRFPGDAKLNPCETPKVCGKYIYWTANKSGSGNLFTYKLKIK